MYIRILVGQSWLWSYGSWIYNHLCSQCLSPLMFWFRILLMILIVSSSSKCPLDTFTYVSVQQTFLRHKIVSRIPSIHFIVLNIVLTMWTQFTVSQTKGLWVNWLFLKFWCTDNEKSSNDITLFSFLTNYVKK